MRLDNWYLAGPLVSPSPMSWHRMHCLVSSTGFSGFRNMSWASNSCKQKPHITHKNHTPITDNYSYLNAGNGKLAIHGKRLHSTAQHSTQLSKIDCKVTANNPWWQLSEANSLTWPTSSSDGGSYFVTPTKSTDHSLHRTSFHFLTIGSYVRDEIKEEVRDTVSLNCQEGISF